MTVSHPPRLNVLLASDAPVAVVFRRGPSKLVRLFLWNREQDLFSAGPWFKGRIYTDRSDISPDGRHLIYFAMGGVRWAIPATGGTWTAISELPSLRAIALWGQGDTWGGGGVFTSSDSFWVDGDRSTFLIRNDSGLREDPSRPAPRSRMERDGWIAKHAGARYVFQKTLPNNWTLCWHAWKGGYALQPPNAATLHFPNWQWSDWDRHRLVWAEAGCLRAAELGAHHLAAIRTLHDFNATPPATDQAPARLPVPEGQSS